MTETTPFFSLIVILTEKNSYLLPFTLDSIAREQSGVVREIIIVDGTGGKTVLAHLPVEGVKVVACQSPHTADLLNTAVKEASGRYIHFLFPGEFYVSDHALIFMKKMIKGYDFPDMIYTTRRVRHQFGQPTVDLFPLTIKILKQVKVPSSLQSYFFRREALIMLGSFSSKYEIACGYELLCRFFLTPTLRKTFVRRVLTDYEYRRVKPDSIVKESLEIVRISFKYFGPSLQFFQWLMQNCLSLLSFSWKIVRASFWKRYVTT